MLQCVAMPFRVGLSRVCEQVSGCVAVCCGVLQCVAVCCRVLLCVAMLFRVGLSRKCEQVSGYVFNAYCRGYMGWLRLVYSLEL